MNGKTMKIIIKAFAFAVMLALAFTLVSCGGGNGGGGDNNGENPDSGYATVSLKNYRISFLTEEGFANGSFYDEGLAQSLVPDPGKLFYVVLDLTYSAKNLTANGADLIFKTTVSAKDASFVLDTAHSTAVKAASEEGADGANIFIATVNVSNTDAASARLIYAATAKSRGELTVSSVVNSVSSVELVGEGRVEKTLEVGAPDFKIVENEYGGYSISNVRKDITALEIPIFYENKPINGISAGAFNGCTAITEIVIPSHIFYVDVYAFKNCTSLKRVTLPDNLSEIGYGAFQGCSSLEYISVPFTGAKSSGASTSFEYIFANGSGNTKGAYVPESLKTVEIRNITELPRYAFDNCGNIETVILPEKLTKINAYAFLGCASLVNIAIPDSVTEFGDGAFMSCASLTSIEIPAGVTTINDRCFAGCSSFTEFTVPDNVTTIGYGAFLGCTALEKITLPFIGKSANTENYLLYIFASQIAASSEVPPSLKSLTVTGEVSLADNTLEKCFSLASITLLSTVKSISASAFEDCESLSEINIAEANNGYSTIDGVLYTKENKNNEEKTVLTYYPVAKADKTFTVADGVDMIGDYAFQNNKYLEQISFGNNENIDRIGNCAFSGCTALRIFGIDSLLSLGTIGYSAFENCIALEKVYAKDLLLWCTINFNSRESSPLHYGAELYIKGNLAENIVILERIPSIKDFAFYNCKTLKSIAIGDSFVDIGQYAFEGCENLTDAMLSDNITSIDSYAFNGCSSLSVLNIPAKLRTIGEFAFKGCSSLSSLSFPTGISTIKRNAFEMCNSIESVTITDLSAWCNISFETKASNPLCQKSTLYVGDTALTSLVVPENITSIGNWAFAGYGKLEYLEADTTLLSIGLGAFSGTSLKSVKLPFVGASADADTDGYFGYVFGSATSVPDTLKRVEIIGSAAIAANSFVGVTSITDLIIGDSVVSIGNNAFSGCTSIKNATVGSSVETIGNGAFFGCASLETLTLPFIDELKYIYDANALKTVILTSATTVGGSAFKGSGVENIILNEGITNIGSQAFADCTQIKEIIIPASVTKIYSMAFSGCSALTSITVSEYSASYKTVDGNLYNRAGTELCAYASGKPDTEFQLPLGVEHIGDYAFSKANNVKSINLENGSLTLICGYALYSCEALETLVIPDTVTEIAKGAIYECRALVTLTIPYVGVKMSTNNINERSLGSIFFVASNYEDNAKYIPKTLANLIITGSYSVDYNAFYGCDMIVNLSLPKTMGTSIANAIDECSSLISITVDSENKYLCSIDGNLYSKDGKTLYRYAAGKTATEFTVPNTVDHIAALAFRDAKSLTSVTLPSTVEKIEAKIFMGCTSLEAVSMPLIGESVSDLCTISYYFGNTAADIPSSLREVTVTGTSGIRDNAFRACKGIVKVTVADTVPSVGDYAFFECTSLSEVTLGASVASIGKYAFDECTSLLEIVIPAAVTFVGEAAFYRACEDLTIKCEAVSKPAEWNALWNAGMHSVEWGYDKGE